MNRWIALAFALVAMPAEAQTMSLHDAIVRAIAHSPDLRALEAAVAEARANATLGDAFRPVASLAATPGYASGLPIAVLGQVPAIGTVEAHRLLYDASARSDQIAAASQVDAALARVESRKREIAQGTAELYARVAADPSLVASAQHRVNAYETIAERLEALRHEGRARDLDVDRAALQVAGAKRSALLAQARFDLDRLRLSGAVGENVTPSETDGVAPKDSSPSQQVTMTNDDPSAMAERSNPELQGLDARIEALQRSVDLTRRLFQPSVAAQIQYSRLFDRYRKFYLTFNPDDFSIGATMTLPLWTGGYRAASTARISAQLAELIAQRDSLHMRIDLDVREAESDIAAASAEGELAERARAVATESLRVAEDLAREGRGEASDIPLAQIALAEAEDDVVNAHAHVAIARARLLILIGELPGK